MEDTAFYNYNRLISLNEVGGNPSVFGISLNDFHKKMARIQERWPRTMLASSTHDTKRSEDVRARINLLSEIPKEWAEAVDAWSEMNDKYRRNGMPDRNFEYYFYQTLAGTWPFEAGRLLLYLQKAIREAGGYTSWTEPNVNYEEAVKRFTISVLRSKEFIDSLEKFLHPLIPLARISSLSQTLIKLTAPGVPRFLPGKRTMACCTRRSG